MPPFTASCGPLAFAVCVCDLYEASDLLLGDHLCGKSQTVQWVDVPHSRKRRLIDHSKLVKLREADPNSTAIFENNLIDTYYPQRPVHMENLCLYEFVAEYTKDGVDEDGNTKYRQLLCYPTTRYTERRSKRVTTILSSSCSSCFVTRKISLGMLRVLLIGT